MRGPRPQPNTLAHTRRGTPLTPSGPPASWDQEPAGHRTATVSAGREDFHLSRKSIGSGRREDSHPSGQASEPAKVSHLPSFVLALLATLLLSGRRVCGPLPDSSAVGNPGRGISWACTVSLAGKPRAFLDRRLRGGNSVCSSSSSHPRKSEAVGAAKASQPLAHLDM